jgi:hypothetical protein
MRQSHSVGANLGRLIDALQQILKIGQILYGQISFEK